MTTQDAPKQQAIFPDCPATNQIVNKDGSMVEEWQLFFQQLILALQTNYGPEGIVAPQQTDANIALLTAIQSIANILYSSTTNVFEGNVLNTADTDASSSGTQFWLPFAMITTYAGNPNTHLPGYLTELCLDTSNQVLYVCTVAGNAAGTTWTAV